MARWPPVTARRAAAWLGAIVLYLVLAWTSSNFAVLGSLTVWYAPAGLALGLGTLFGWRSLPALAVGELCVGLYLFGVADDFGALVVPNGIAYAAVYAAGGVVTAQVGRIRHEATDWRPLPILATAVATTMAAAVVGVSFQSIAGVEIQGGAARAMLVWWLGDMVGVVGVGVTVLAIAVRQRRGGRWWAVPEAGNLESIGLVALPSLLAIGAAAATDTVAPFVAAVFLPTLALAARGGVAAVALSAPFTSLTMTAVVDSTFGTDVIRLSDLQVVLLLLLITAFGVAVVVEQLRNTRERSQIRQQHLDDAQLQAGAGSFRWDVLDDEVEWSPGLHALFGTEDGPVTAADYLARVHEQDRAAVGDAIATVLATGEPVDHTYRAVRGDGRELSLRARLVPRSFDGRVVELLGTCTDITAEVEARRQLGRVVRAEQDARAAEEEARRQIARTERIKDALLVAVSHEVRTPLTVLRGVADTLRRPEVQHHRLDEHADLIDRLGKHVDRLRRVLRDLLDVDRIGRGVVMPVRRPCDLRALAEEVVEHLDAGDRDVHLDVPGGEVLVDARLVARILEHLLANAVRHGGGDGPITVVGMIRPDEVELRVDDDGPGIAPGDHERVFDAFERGHDDAHSPGAGVGLFLVQRFAELHGGEVTVTSGPRGRGSSFHVTFPLAPAPVAG